MPFQISSTNSMLGSNRAHQSISLALEQSRLPSTTNDVEVSIVMSLTNTGGGNSDITRYDIEISPDNSTWTNIGIDRISTALGVTNYLICTVVIIPAGWWYRISSRFSNYGTVQINMINELIL